MPIYLLVIHLPGMYTHTLQGANDVSIVCCCLTWLVVYFCTPGASSTALVKAGTSGVSELSRAVCVPSTTAQCVTVSNTHQDYTKSIFAGALFQAPVTINVNMCQHDHQ